MKMKLSCNGDLIYLDKDPVYSNILWIDCDKNIDRRIHINSNIRISIKENRCVEIYMPPYYVGDLFYAINDGIYVISDSLYVVAEELGTVTIDKKMEQYFALKGYCPSGSTLFKEITRLENNVTYCFDKALVQSHNQKRPSIITTKKSDYMEFKRILNKIVDRLITERPAVLLSGGADSRLIALLLANRNPKTKIITALSSPLFEGNAKDVYLANEISRILKLEVLNAHFEFKDADVKDWHELIKLMPCCSHSAFVFQSMFHCCHQAHVDAVWSGQNMDTLYNLGPTERFGWNRCGIGAAFKRFFMSESYFSTLPDIKEKSSLWAKVLAKVGCKAFQKAYGRSDLTLPKNKNELISNFFSSRFYTIFGHDDIINNNLISAEGKLFAYELKRELFKVKMSFLKGGDASVISAIGNCNNIDVILPYSEPEMVDYFDGLHLTYKDIINPKRFVYKYIREFSCRYGSGINNYDISSNKIRNSLGNISEISSVFRNILDNTNIGMELSYISGTEGKDSVDEFLIKVHRYWMKYEYELLREQHHVLIEG